MSTPRSSDFAFAASGSTQEPLETGGATTAVFDDTCGNLIQIASQT